MSRYILLLLLFTGLFACKKINTVRLACSTEQVQIPIDTSYLSTPLVIPTQLLEAKLNDAVGTDVLVDNDFGNINHDGKKDKLKMKVSRLGDIKVQWTDNKALYQVPLLVLIERQIVGKSALPFSKSLALKTEFSLRLKFQTTVDIGEDWQLQPKTQFVSFSWLSEVRAFGGLINVKKMVERKLLHQMPQILANMDDTIRAKVRLDRAVSRVWQNIQKPIRLDQQKNQVWLKINPIRFEMGAITTDGDNLLIQSRLSATTETILGDAPLYAIDSSLPPLVKRKSLPNTAYVYMLSEIPYSDFNHIISHKLVGNSFEVSGHHIKVKGAELWGCDSNLVLHLKIGGDLRGDIYFTGRPVYEPDSQRLQIRHFDFDLQTQQTLLASADWLLHSSFKEQINSALSIPLSEQILKIPGNIMQGLERGQAGKQMDFQIEQWDFKPQQIWVRPTDIAILVIVNARVRVELEQIGKN